MFLRLHLTLLLAIASAQICAHTNAVPACSQLLLAGKETQRIEKKEALLGPAESLEAWVVRHKTSLGKIVGDTNETMAFSAMGYLHEEGFIHGAEVTVGGNLHADGWHTELQPDGTLLLNRLSEAKSSLRGYVVEGRFQIQGFLSRLLQDQPIRIRGDRIDRDQMRVSTKYGGVTLEALREQFGTSLHGDWGSFKDKYDELFYPDFYEVLVPRSDFTDAKLGPLIPFLRSSPASIEELRAKVWGELQEAFPALRKQDPQVFWEHYRDLVHKPTTEGNSFATAFLRKVILDEAGNVALAYQGQGGLMRIADEAFLGDMRGPAKLASKHFSTALRSQLDWGKVFQGSTTHFRKVRNALTSEEGIKQYQGASGYVQFAKEFERNSLQQAYSNASAALTAQEFNRLNWPKAFAGTPEKREETRNALTGEDGIAKYQGATGYARYAKEFENDSLKKAFANASAALTTDEFKQLTWPKGFSGTPVKREETRNALTSKEGIAKYQGATGYALYAKEFENDSLNKAFANASAALTTEEFKKLNWPKGFSGTPVKREDTRNALTSKQGITKYQGATGYARYAKEFEKNSLAMASKNARAALTSEEFNKLNWPKGFQGTPEKREETRNTLTSEAGIAKYHGATGYARYAQDFEDNSLHKAFKNASAALTPEEFKKLNWPNSFIGTPDKFEETRNTLTSEAGITKYNGPGGYRQYANDFEDGKTIRAHQNARSALSEEEFSALGWGPR